MRCSLSSFDDGAVYHSEAEPCWSGSDFACVGYAASERRCGFLAEGERRHSVAAVTKMIGQRAASEMSLFMQAATLE